MKTYFYKLACVALLLASPATPLHADGLNNEESANLVDVAFQPINALQGKFLRLRMDVPIPAGKRSMTLVNAIPTNVRRDKTVVTCKLVALGFVGASSVDRNVPAGTFFKITRVLSLEKDAGVLSRIDLKEVNKKGELTNSGGLITNLSCMADKKLTIYELLTFAHYYFGPSEKWQ